MAIARSVLSWLAIAAIVDCHAQQALPSADSPTLVAQLARRTSDFRKDKVGRKLELTYPSGQRAWQLVHACVRRNEGSIKAMKQSLGREFKGADKDPWKAYGLALQAYHLHHAGEFPKHLADEFLVYLETWDRGIFRGLDPDQPFDRRSVPCHLPTAACAAALAGEAQLPSTHRFVGKALDRLRNAPPSHLVHLNATLQSALISGRIGEFRNDAWRTRLDLLRDTLPPNGSLPAEDIFRGPASVFTDLGAALRVGAVLFGDSSYLYAANKFQAAAVREEANPGRYLSPLQWAYLSYEALDAMKLVVPPAHGVARDTTFALRTGHHPRTAFLLCSGESPSLDFRAGGSRLASESDTFLVGPGHAITCDPTATTVEDRKGDAAGSLAFTIGKAGEGRLTRRVILTREGILLIADRVDGDRALAERRLGPAWPVGAGLVARGANWFACRATEHFLPPGYEGKELSALVWFAPQDGMTMKAGDQIVAQTSEGREGPMEFLTVVVPFPAGLDAASVAKAIASEGLKQVRVGKVVIERQDDTWTVSRD